MKRVLASSLCSLGIVRHIPGIVVVRRITHSVVIFLSMVFFAALLFGCTEDTVELRFLVPQLDLDREVAKNIAAALNEQTMFHITLIEVDGTGQSELNLLSTGEADIALVSNGEEYRPDIAAVLPIYPSVLHIAYRSEYAVETIADIFSAASIYTGPPNSVSRLLVEETAEIFDLDLADIHFVEDDQCADVLVVYAPIIPRTQERVARCGRYRLFSLGAVEELGRGSFVDSVSLLYPTVKPFVIPVGTYRSIPKQPVVTLAVENVLVARSDIAERVVYELIAEISRLQPALSAAYPSLFYRLTGEFDSIHSTFALHPGAQAYLRRDQPAFYERYSGLLELVITVLLATVSGAYAMLQVYKRRRKNRVDNFNHIALDIRARGLAAADSVTRDQAITELIALQQEAFDQLGDEKLEADQGFQIFLSLSNRVLSILREEAAKSRV